MTSIAIIADYNPESETHLATDSALQHAAKYNQMQIGVTWIPTREAHSQVLRNFHGVIIGTGVFENRSNLLNSIRYTRENDIPTLATCGGFQHMMLEYARNAIGVSDAEHAEFDPTAVNKVIVPLACSLRGRTMELTLTPNSQVNSLYQTTQTREQYYCSFGVSPNFVEMIADSPLRIVGSDAEGVLRITELPSHPFFIGTLFVPQIRSTDDVPHPLIVGLLRAAQHR
jgi:CTP synthase (UTP-ammonia lyase)